MRRNKLFGIMLLLLLGSGWAGCFHSLQTDRNSGSSFAGLDGGNPPNEVSPIDERETLDLLRQRAETRGERPGEAQVVSLLDSLNERFSYRAEESRGAQVGELAEVVVHLLRDPSEEVRFRAAELLGKIGTPTQENSLIETSEKDPSLVVREMAAESLEHLGLGYEVWSE